MGRDPTTGVPASIEAVYRRDAERLWRSVFLATRDREVTSDAVAEAFAQALRRGDELRDARGWVWTAAFRIARSQMASEDRLSSDHEPSFDVPEPMVDLWQAIGSLSRHQRTAIVLADYAGFSHREIAEVLGSSAGAVAVHVHRARRRLRELLKE